MTYLTQFNKYTYKLSPLALAVALYGCGGTGQDLGLGESQSASNSQTFSGLAIDGYLARSTVYIDTNNNGTRDAWEEFAFTDNDGYYSYNPLTNTNYCAADATAEHMQYCLRTNTRRTNLVIRVDGGYDISTGEPFVGQLSKRLNVLEDATEVDSSVVSPLTSLLTNVESETQRTQVLESLSLSESDLSVNYLNEDNNNSVNTRILNSALKVHKVTSILADRLTDNYDAIGTESGTPNDATPFVYNTLANTLANAGTSFDNIIESEQHLTSILDMAETNIRNVYENKELDLPPAVNTNQRNRAMNVSRQTNNVINHLLTETTVTGGENSNVNGLLRGIESLVIKAIEEDETEDTSIESAVNFFTNDNNQSLVNSLVEALNSDLADVSALSQNDFSGDDFDSVQEISDSATLSSDTQRFSEIAGMQLRVSDLDLGRAPDNLKDMEFELYFEGTQGSNSGAFSACAKYIEEANIDGTLGEANTRGELIDGYWSLLGASSNNSGSYNLLLTINFLGATYQAIMKIVGTTEINGVQYHQIRFDNDGDYRIWHSAEGMVERDSAPATNADCEERLPMRHDI